MIMITIMMVSIIPSFSRSSSSSITVLMPLWKIAQLCNIIIILIPPPFTPTNLIPSWRPDFLDIPIFTFSYKWNLHHRLHTSVNWTLESFFQRNLFFFFFVAKKG